jgi:hypothetical protein
LTSSTLFVGSIATLFLARCIALRGRRNVLDELHLIGMVLREHVLPAALSAIGRLFDSSFWDETNRLTEGRGDVDAAVAWFFRLLGAFLANAVRRLLLGTSTSGHVPLLNLWNPHPLCEDFFRRCISSSVQSSE